MGKDQKEYKQLTRVEGYVKPYLKTFAQQEAQRQNTSISKVLENALTKLRQEHNY